LNTEDTEVHTVSSIATVRAVGLNTEDTEDRRGPPRILGGELPGAVEHFLTGFLCVPL